MRIIKQKWTDSHSEQKWKKPREEVSSDKRGTFPKTNFSQIKLNQWAERNLISPLKKWLMTYKLQYLYKQQWAHICTKQPLVLQTINQILESGCKGVSFHSTTWERSVTLMQQSDNLSQIFSKYLVHISHSVNSWQVILLVTDVVCKQTYQPAENIC